MDAAAHYRHLLTLGRDEFLAAAAPAVLVRYRAYIPATRNRPIATTLMIERDVAETMDATVLRGRFTPETIEMELYPLAKKPGASFPDRITIGRTSNNDVVIVDPSVSRLHAYVRVANDSGEAQADWLIADAGSKNGSWLNEAQLEPRKEAALPPRTTLRLGDVELAFYPSTELFSLLGGEHGRR